MPAPEPEPPRSLPPERLRPVCDPAALSGAAQESTDDGLIGQERALDAIAFGVAIDQPGFNLFVLGPEGLGRHGAAMRLAAERADSAPAPDDWAYVHNFETAWKPRALRLPNGTAVPFRDAVTGMMADLRGAIPALFEGEDYRERRREIDEAAQEEQNTALNALQEKASAQGIGLMRTPMGFAFAPVKDGKVVKPDAFNELPEEERKRIQEIIEGLQKELQEVLQDMPAVEKRRREKVRALNAEMAASVIDAAIGEVAARFEGIDAVSAHLDAMRADLIDRVELFMREDQQQSGNQAPDVSVPVEHDPRCRRYLANPVIANGGDAAGTEPGRAPVVHEMHPTLARLIGRVEHVSRMGALETDHLMIRPGALHRANGGFLVLDALRLLREPWAWDALKRALRSGEIAITSVSQELSLMSTVSLEPAPIPLALKVILIGERMLYYLLSELDPEFRELFKVEADFDEEIPWQPDTLPLFARLVGRLADKHDLMAPSPEGTAAVIEEAARIASDAERLTLSLGRLLDLMREADHWARDAGAGAIAPAHVARAISEQTRRADRLRQRSHEQIDRGIRMIATEGTAAGQVNGLSVLQIGATAFGQPARITARVRTGAGKLVDIERESKLGGPIHSKGVLILSSYLAATYALETPMSLWASLVFEQSYGGVEGDSASSAELYALLSALSGVAIRQSHAVTGSVNQLGEVQAIGGVNEKIEGFFDVCAARGLTGEQGVLIPEANIAHLVLRPRVIDAVAEGRFAIHPVAHVDEGIAILTGVAAGVRGADGRFPAGSINALTEARLERFAEARRAFVRHAGADAEDDDDPPS